MTLLSSLQLHITCITVLQSVPYLYSRSLSFYTISDHTVLALNPPFLIKLAQELRFLQIDVREHVFLSCLQYTGRPK